ncbi:MAG: NAD(P)H-hydrate dehydratase [Myxococcota bacterium]
MSRPSQTGSPAPRVVEAGTSHRRGIWPLVQAAEMQALDRQTIDGRGVAGEILMESAGRALVEPVLALRRASDRPGRPVRALCGAGNNGGDGFVLVRHLHAEGVPAEAILLGDPARLPADAAANWRRLAALGAGTRVLDPAAPGVEWAALLDDTSVAVDALFGTGLTRPLEGAFASLVEAVADARGRGLRVLSVDMPSGIAADTGQVLGAAIRADETVTISLPKVGLALEPGRSHAGSVRVARVGIDDPVPGRADRIELWARRAAADLFPRRPRDGHKGRFGHVLVVAGSAGKLGAASLCSRAAVRAGAGLVTLAHPAGCAAEIPGRCAEVMTEELPATKGGSFARAGEAALRQLAAARDVVAIGPGLGRDPETVELVRGIVGVLEGPLVVDADGLFALQGEALAALHDRRAATVLTPHPGEAARLLGGEAKHVNADRIGAARRLATASRAVVVLKGAGTVVADPAGRALVIPTGGPVLASGGTGDVLTGIVAALLAAGLSGFDAAGLAAWWHGAAADRAGEAAAGFGLLASELADGLAEAAQAIRTGARGEGADEGLLLRFPGP